MGATLLAPIKCSIDIPDGTHDIQLSTKYDLNLNTDASAEFPGRDPSRKASLWWGESLLAWYYIELTSKLRSDPSWNDAVDHTSKGYIEIRPKRNVSTPDDLHVAKFTNEFALYFVKGTNMDVSVADLTYPYTFFPAAQAISLIFYETIMADLGQDSLNVLSNGELLELYSSNITSIKTNPKSGGYLLSRMSSLAREPYTAKTASQWDLGISGSTLSGTYLCQIPRLKSTGTLIWSVLIANLVLLKALWSGFEMVVDAILVRKNPALRSCSGCERNSSSNVAPEGVQLLPVGKSGSHETQEEVYRM
jgi:hypothetical protein